MFVILQFHQISRGTNRHLLSLKPCVFLLIHSHIQTHTQTHGMHADTLTQHTAWPRLPELISVFLVIMENIETGSAAFLCRFY